MFANFIYFIIALLVLTLYQPPDRLPFTGASALLLFLALAGLFGIYTRYQFERLRRQAHRYSTPFLDHRFSLLATRHAILALCVFAVDIWALHLPAYLGRHAWYTFLPTAGALLFLLLFAAYLIMVWHLSYDAHREIYRTDMSRRTYVYSNAAFSIPILIPWALLFGISDLIARLPWELPRRLLETTFGQIGFFLVFLLLAACLAPVLIRRFWRCRPLEAGDHRHRIAELCRQSDVSYADIVYWPIFGGRMITAGVMGLVGRFRYILVTKALLEILTPAEIDQVIAHEIGHVKRRHLLLYLLFFIGFMLISYAVFPLSYYLVFFYNPFLTTLLTFSLDPAQWVDIVGGAMLVLAVIVYFRYVFGYFMRNFERQADLFVFSLFPSAQPLIATFDKIVHTSGQPADKPNWHHFSIQQRVDYLRRSEADPRWIAHHDKKVRTSILLFLSGLALGGLAVYQLNHYVFTQEHRRFNAAVVEKYIAEKEEITVADAPVFFFLGDLYLYGGKYDQAARSYTRGLALNPHFQEKHLVLSKLGSAHFEAGDHRGAAAAWGEALRLSGDDADLLNNLAWLAATTHDPTLYDPVLALELARHALRLKTAAHILDTYAQALFVNGRIAEAIAAEREALALDPEDRHIYEAQLEKFLQAPVR